jgi:sulfur relay (sulfurtransferase) DsrC/TusE family protein
MKSILAITSVIYSLSSLAFQTEFHSQYFDPFSTTDAENVTPLKMKSNAIKIINDAEDYFENEQMSPHLKFLVKNIKNQNAEISEREAVNIVVQFAHVHF